MVYNNNNNYKSSAFWFLNSCRLLLFFPGMKDLYDADFARIDFVGSHA